MKLLRRIALLLFFAIGLLGLGAWWLSSNPFGTFQDQELNRSRQALLFKGGKVRVLPSGEMLGTYQKRYGKWIYENLGNTWEIRPSLFQLEMIPEGGFVSITVKTNLVLNRIYRTP